MTDIDETQVLAMVDAADHDSVTAELLAGGDRYSQLYLYDDPVVSYLESHEQPHYTFFSEMKGVGIDTKRNTVTPDSSGLAVITITDRRLFIIVGKEVGDEFFEVAYGDITGVEYSHGLMKHRLVVRTDDTTYHCWIDSSYSESALVAATDALRTYRDQATSQARSPGSSSPIPSDGGADSNSSETADTSASNGTEQSVSHDAGADDDPLEMLERLSELNDAGVISDEEFEEKKRDLLDQI